MSSPRAFSSQAVTAVILAGGASSRMGRNKALLHWHGRPFLAHIIDALQRQAAHIAINAPSTNEFSQFRLPLVADHLAARCGPLAGIMAALDYSTTAFTLVVPCDNPRIAPQLAARLGAALAHEDCDLAYACTRVDNGAGDNHYLYALMRTSLRDSLADFLLREDYAVRRWYATLRASAVDFSAEPHYFCNINSTDDFAQLDV